MISPLFKDDSDRLKMEYDQLKDKNIELYNIINDLAIFMQTKLNASLVLTMIYRTDEEQAEIYKNDPKFQEKPFKSPHQFLQAFDTRTLNLNPNQITTIVNYLNNKYNSDNYYKFTCLYHEIPPHGKHLHTQFLKKSI